MTGLLLAFGNLSAATEFLHTLEVPDLFNESFDLCVVADGRIDALRIGQLADPCDQFLPVSTGPALSQPCSNLRIDT